MQDSTSVVDTNEYVRYRYGLKRLEVFVSQTPFEERCWTVEPLLDHGRAKIGNHLIVFSTKDKAEKFIQQLEKDTPFRPQEYPLQEITRIAQLMECDGIVLNFISKEEYAFVLPV